VYGNARSSCRPEVTAGSHRPGLLRLAHQSAAAGEYNGASSLAKGKALCECSRASTSTAPYRNCCVTWCEAHTHYGSHWSHLLVNVCCSLGLISAVSSSSDQAPKCERIAGRQTGWQHTARAAGTPRPVFSDVRPGVCYADSQSPNTEARAARHRCAPRHRGLGACAPTDSDNQRPSVTTIRPRSPNTRAIRPAARCRKASRPFRPLDPSMSLKNSTRYRSVESASSWSTPELCCSQCSGSTKQYGVLWKGAPWPTLLTSRCSTRLHGPMPCRRNRGWTLVEYQARSEDRYVSGSGARSAVQAIQNHVGGGGVRHRRHCGPLTTIMTESAQLTRPLDLPTFPAISVRCPPRRCIEKQ